MRFLKIYLFEMQGYRRKGKDRGVSGDLPSTGSLLKWQPQAGLRQAKARTQEFLCSLPCGDRGPSIWTVFTWFLRHISRMLDPKPGVEMGFPHGLLA